MKGKVAPEETIPFIVTLKASVHASFYSMDLICKVGPPSKRSWMAHSSQSWGGAVVCEIPRSPQGPSSKGQALEEWGDHSTGPGQGPPDLVFSLLVLSHRCTSRNA